MTGPTVTVQQVRVGYQVSGKPLGSKWESRLPSQWQTIVQQVIEQATKSVANHCAASERAGYQVSGKPLCSKWESRLSSRWQTGAVWCCSTGAQAQCPGLAGHLIKVATMGPTPGQDRVTGYFSILTQQFCRLVSPCLSFACTLCTKIVVHVKEPTSTFYLEKA